MLYMDSICDGLHQIFPDKSKAEFKSHILKGRKKGSRNYLLYPKRISYIQYKEAKRLPVFNLNKYKGGFHEQAFNQRKKPFGSLAMRTLGDMYPDIEQGAKNGLELSYDSILKGREGITHRQKVMNKYLNIVDIPPVDGCDIITTIDVGMQDIAEKALVDKLKEINATVGVAILMEVQTGEIKVESLKPLVRVIDDDDAMRRSWAFLIEGEGWDVAVYSDALDFISSGDFQRPGCLVLDVRMPRMSGLELQDKMRELGIDLPIIFISGHGDIDMAVRTLKLGAVDFLQKPVDDQRLLTAIGSAVMNNLNHRRTEMELSSFRSRLMQLTQREREVIRMVAHGMSNKQVAENLGISEKTVQVHRGSAYRKLDLHNAAEIARLLLRSGDPL